MKKGQIVYENGRQAEVTALNYADGDLWQVEIVYSDGTPTWNVAWVHPRRLKVKP